MTHHWRCTSLAFAEIVLMSRKRARNLGVGVGTVNGYFRCQRALTLSAAMGKPLSARSSRRRDQLRSTPLNLKQETKKPGTTLASLYFPGFLLNDTP